MAKNIETLYDRIGGDFAINAAVDDLYNRVLNDRMLAPYFANISMNDQLGKMKSFLKIVFGGKQDADIPDLRAAHAPFVDKGLWDGHMDRLMGHLKSTLQDLSVSSDLITEVIARVDGYRDDVLCR